MASLNPCFNIRRPATAILLAATLTLLASAGQATGTEMLRKKSVPAITLKNLSPPYPDHPYFQNSEFAPFEPWAAAFSRINAWWLAEASTLVYADETFTRQRFAEAGFQRVIFFDRSGTQGYVARHEHFALIAFRGSEIWKRNESFDPTQVFADLKTNIDIRLTDWDRGGKVHKGFKTALDAVWADLLPETRRLQERDVPIWITGHSLGAALATLAADRLRDVQGLYTFGSPRVGNQQFRDRFSVRAFRVVNGRDIVADVPPKGPYRHVGEHVWIDRKGDIHFGPGAGEASGEADCFGDPSGSAPEEEIRESRSAPYIPASIRDHVPLLYSIYLWNGWVGHSMTCAGR